METLDTADTLAKFLKVTRACIRKWTISTDIPLIRCGRLVRYDRGEVLTWLRARSVTKE